MEAGVTPDSRRYNRTQVIFFCCITAGGGALVAGGGWWVVGWPAILHNSNNCLLIWNDDELLKLSWYLFESSGNILGHPCFQWTCTYYKLISWSPLNFSDIRHPFSAFDMVWYASDIFCVYRMKRGLKKRRKYGFLFLRDRICLCLGLWIIGWVIRCAACWNRNCEEGSC